MMTESCVCGLKGGQFEAGVIVLASNGPYGRPATQATLPRHRASSCMCESELGWIEPICRRHERGSGVSNVGCRISHPNLDQVRAHSGVWEAHDLHRWTAWRGKDVVECFPVQPRELHVSVFEIGLLPFVACASWSGGGSKIEALPRPAKLKAAQRLRPIRAS
jgi:hypothetical protein